MAARGRVKTMVPRACSTLDSHPKVKQSRATQAFPLLSHKPHSSRLTTGLLGLVKFLPYDIQSPAYLLEYTMAVSDSLFEEDGVFRFCVDTCQLNMSKDLLYTHARRFCTCRVWLSMHPLLSAYLLTTYTYKRIRLLTRIYGIPIVCRGGMRECLKACPFFSLSPGLETNPGKNTSALLMCIHDLAN